MSGWEWVRERWGEGGREETWCVKLIKNLKLKNNYT